MPAVQRRKNEKKAEAAAPQPETERARSEDVVEGDGDFDKKDMVIIGCVFLGCQMSFRMWDCSKVSTCAIPWIPPVARLFFMSFNSLLLAAMLYMTKKAERTEGEQAADDAKYLRASSQKLFLKGFVLFAVHLSLGLMAPLACSCFVTAYSLPLFRDRERAMWLRYGLGK
eukprot:TRINITY_DN18854_c0_g1_i2.p1 TRINITY_DN18854_c0_g1~~TRINITY_DN18854_c0_g1_i2.p1  ORF type:complete len:170 (-),score=22.51 TRINITY_DN18854_c0_g1_i2:79-588(-)